MRGKVSLVDFIRSRLGITPAHAGKSSYSLSERCIKEDHPRTCGEKDLEKRQAVILIGSPPHMRGKV